MKINIKLFIQYFTILLLSTIINIAYSQNASQDETYYSIYDDFVGAENSELNNGVGFLQQYRTVENTHVYYENHNFVEGKINYKKQSYKTKLKYDILNDLVIVKYIDSKGAFLISLNSKLIDNFTIEKHHFVRLPMSENLKSFYINGFFESIYKGEEFSLYVKHRKKIQKNKDYLQIYYKFLDEKVFVFEYKNQFYEIKNKRDISKVVSHLKKEINTFFRNRKFDIKSLLRLFTMIDKNSKK